MQTLIIREGKALPEEHPKKIVITGVGIGAISAFLAIKENHKFIKEGATLVVNRAKGTMVLDGDPSAPVGGLEIKQEVILDERFLEWGINTKKLWDKTTLLEFVRIRPHFFCSKPDYLVLISALNQTNAKYSAMIVNDKEVNGSKETRNAIVSEYKPIEFTLKFPVIAGNDPMSFLVAVNMEIRERDFSFYLESPELAEILYNEREKALKGELETVLSLNLPIVGVYQK